MCGDHMMSVLTHFIGIIQTIKARYGIDLPGSLHTNKIPVILGWYSHLGYFCHLNIVPLDRDTGTFNSSSTDVVEKLNFLVAASHHRGTSVAEGSPYHVDRNGFVLVTFHGGILSCGFSQKRNSRISQKLSSSFVK